MEKAQAQQFRDRWRAVEEIELQEARAATIELRWRQLNALYRLSRILQLPAIESDEMQVYERWARLKEGMSQSARI